MFCHSKCKEKHYKNECKRYCDACGKAMKGFIYHCVAHNLDLHLFSSVQGWAYASSNEDYYVAVQNEGGSGSDDDDDKSVAEMSKMELQHNSKGNEGRGNKYWKMLKSILKIIMCVL
ncbi:hypothetical protein PVL29_017126 [Vitis rotundifolia]|uniref:Uncharacterized protein n=1 Tax=Vitis rotundifolia TaxID=103349 RepID=A0AA38ZAQ0_VITRO|nr:hypothetical protein PVL29_017126 [Vitis rotundifolia]